MAGPETEEHIWPKKKRGKAAGRAYTRHERNTIELMLDREPACRAIAAELGRVPSTVSNEVAAHRIRNSEVIKHTWRSSTSCPASSCPKSPREPGRYCTRTWAGSTSC